MQGLVNVLIENRATIGDISYPTDICFGDVQNPQLSGHQSQPLIWGYGVVLERAKLVVLERAKLVVLERGNVYIYIYICIYIYCYIAI